MAKAQRKRASKPSAPAAAQSGAALPPYSVATWPADKIKPYDRNARVHGKEQIQQLRSSFRKFGQVWPILVREDGTIIAGHGRLEAAKAEGFKSVQVIVATGWTEDQCRAFGLLDNRVPLNAEWHPENLGIELAALFSAGVDLEELGFAPLELEDLKASAVIQGLTDPDDAPEAPVVPASRLGDLWILGKHRLLCGDSTKAKDVSLVLGGAKPHLMVTDPPYGVNYDPAWRQRAGVGGKNTATGTVLNDDIADWTPTWKLFPGSVAYVWHGGLHSAVVATSLKSAGFDLRAQIIWHKPRFALSRGHYHWQHEPAWYVVKHGEKADGWTDQPEPRFVEDDHEVMAYAVQEGSPATWKGGRRQSTIWTIEHRKSDTGHGTQKPVECMKRPIENNSLPGQGVYEPFSGSGTTIIAGEMTARSIYAIELNPAYVDVAIKRWQDFTGEKAKLDGDGRDFEAVAAERLPKAA